MKILILALLASSAAVAGGPSPEIDFKMHTLDLGRSEACAVADVNGDGRPDVISGENWYEGPSWKKHPYRSVYFWNNYIDDFSDLPLDADGDGDVDVVSVGWGGRKIVWLENPGKGEGMWKEQVVDSGSPTEFAFLVDLDNDGKKDEILPQFGGREGATAWFEAESKGGKVTWRKNIASDKLYGHGIGAGDVNGDGRADILTPKGWLEAPPDPRKGLWTLHADYSFEKHTGFLFAFDVNGDGKNDIVTSHAHDYGVMWLEQGEKDGRRTFETKLIDDAWSQAHAMTMQDMTGDGYPELITGKRLYAHNGHDPGERESLGLYWYERVGTGKQMEWARHIIHYGGRVGGGMQIPVADVDGDGDLDVVVGGKGGLFLFERR